MYLSPLRDASWIFLKHEMEVNAKHALAQLIKEEGIDLFFDIGANLGAYSWIAREHGVKYSIMLEPDPVNANLIRKTIEKNKLNDCFLIEAAAASETSILTFFQDQASGATGSLINESSNEGTLHKSYRVGEQTFQTICLSLNAFTELAKSKKVAIKIDSEGAELDILTGGTEFLRVVRPHIIVESFRHVQKIREVLEPLGYAHVNLDDSGNILYSPSQKVRP
jgi:FkbM family methyltransferase